MTLPPMPPLPMARHAEGTVYFDADMVAYAEQYGRLCAEAAHAAQQAKIDRLMLEYCPDEMTAEQLAEWERHQVITQVQAIVDAASDRLKLKPLA